MPLAEARGPCVVAQREQSRIDDESDANPNDKAVNENREELPGIIGYFHGTLTGSITQVAVSVFLPAKFFADVHGGAAADDARGDGVVMNAEHASGDQRAEAGQFDDLSDFLQFSKCGRGRCRGHVDLL
jgi:hypothetical protein